MVYLHVFRLLPPLLLQLTLRSISTDNMAIMEHTFDTSRYDIRPATAADVPAMVELYYQSFYVSHPFWPILMPRADSVDEWWRGTFKLGIENPKARTFLVIDTQPREEAVGLLECHAPAYTACSSTDFCHASRSKVPTPTR